MDFVKFLGGLALGASGAALYTALRKDRMISGAELGQGVVTGGFGGGPGGGGFGGPGVVTAVGPGGGAFGGGPGLVVGPGSSPGGFGGPSILDFAPSGYGDGFFWPLNVNPWLYQEPRAPLSLVCRNAEVEDGEDVLLCEQAYPVRRPAMPVGQVYAWGPAAGWL